MASPAVDDPLTKSKIQIFSDMIESIRLDDFRDVIRLSDTVVLLQGAITGGAFALVRLIIPNIVQEPLFGLAGLVCMAAAFVIYSEGYRAPKKEQPQPEEA